MFSFIWLYSKLLYTFIYHGNMYYYHSNIYFFFQISFQYITFNIPLLLCLSRTLEQHTNIVTPAHGTRTRLTHVAARHAPITFLASFQLYMSITGVWSAYGTMAMMINPVRTWAVVLAFVLHYLACKRRVSKTVYNLTTNSSTELRDTSL